MATMNSAVSTEKTPNAAIQGQFGSLEVVEVNTETWEAKFRVVGSIRPEFSTRLSMIQPSSEEDTEALWRMLMEDILQRLRSEDKVPQFVKGFEVNTGVDSTADPAVYVTILVEPKRHSDEMLTRFVQFSELVQQKLLGLHLKRYTYVNIGELRRGK